MMPTPNVILIVADDLGYGDFGRFNGGESSTPALDRMMDEGLTLAQHYAASPVCAPSRAGILTGRSPHRTGVLDTLEARGGDRLALRERTIADVLRAADYRTGLVGKWHNGALDARYHPTRRGFDEFVGFSGGWIDYWEWRNMERGTSPFPADGRYATEVFTAEALDFVRRHQDRPFFLHLAYSAPHLPIQAPEAEIQEFRRDGRTETVATIYAMIAAMDRGIAALLELLEELHIDENTIVMFTSDNGPQLDGDHARPNLGLRGQKMHTFEGGIRVPMIVRWPAAVAAARTSDAVVHATDWFPTLVELCGATDPDHRVRDGRSVAGLLVDDEDFDGPPRFWQWNRYRPIRGSNGAMRDGRWKLVRSAIPETFAVLPEDARADFDLKYPPDAPITGDSPWDVLRSGVERQLPAARYSGVAEVPEPDFENLVGAPSMLFDLEADPCESVDLATRFPDVLRRMDAEFDRWFDEVEAERATISAQSRAGSTATSL